MAEVGGGEKAQQCGCGNSEEKAGPVSLGGAPEAAPFQGDPFEASSERRAAYVRVLESVRHVVAEHVEDERCREILRGGWRICEEHRTGYLGHCHGVHREWRLVSTQRKQSTQNTVRAVYVRVVRDEASCECGAAYAETACGEARRLLPITVCIATLLHEMAHALTPGELVYSNRPPDGSSGRNPARRQRIQWFFDAHSALFYENFAMLLRVAERLRVFVLPRAPDKHSMRSLRRFDDKDADVAPPPPSSAPLFAAEDGSLAVEAEWRTNDELEGLVSHAATPAQCATRKYGPVRVNVSTMRRGRMVRKVVVAPERSADVICQYAASKIGVKTVRKAIVEHGGRHTPLDEVDLATLGSELTLVIV